MIIVGLTRGAKFVIYGAVAASAVFGTNWYIKNHGSTKSVSAVPSAQGQLADFQDTEGSAQPAANGFVAPSAKPAAPGHVSKKALVLAWNGELGLLLANGGPKTTEGSLMNKYGVDLTLERQDDYGKMQESLVACATQLSQGARNCTLGANYAVIMGDGGPAFLTGLNGLLAKLGPDYNAKVIGAVGRSDGEDGFWAPQKVKDNPANAKGLLVAAVKMDGDWNIAMLFGKANVICNNPDVTTYDPDCINWVATSSFTEADDKYNQKYCEDRPVVRGNKKTGATQHVCVDAVCTWTPGDVAIAMGRGGAVPIMTTHDNPAQMAATVIGIQKDYNKDAEYTLNMLRAALEGGNMIKSGGRPALLAAGGIAAKVFGEQTASYWAKYYRGVEEDDATGVSVHLGGSRVFNLADNQLYFGLNGGENKYAITYDFFGKIDVQQYPGDLPSYLPPAQIMDTGFLSKLASTGVVAGSADTNSFDNAPATSETIAQRPWNITFDTGRATISPTSEATLQQLLQQLVIAGNTRVEIHGHTDNTGTSDNNVALSNSRALSVQNWLVQHAPQSFPANRVKVYAHGQSMPVCTTNDAACLAQNRRVEIVLKSN